jgi:hypothetical protein
MKSKKYIKLYRLAKRNSIHLYSNGRGRYEINYKYKDVCGNNCQDEIYNIRTLNNVEYELNFILKQKKYRKSNEYRDWLESGNKEKTLLSELFLDTYS